MKPAWNIEEESRELEDIGARAEGIRKLLEATEPNLFDALARTTREKISLLEKVQKMAVEGERYRP